MLVAFLGRIISRPVPGGATSLSCIGSISFLTLAGSVLLAQTACTPPSELAIRADAAPTADTYAAQGAWFGERGRFACADSAFRSALKMDPSSAKINYFLGVSLYSAGQVEAAIAPLSRSAALDAKAVRPRVLLASILWKLGRKSEATEQWKAVLALDPASTDALDGLSHAMIQKGDFMAAIGLLRNAKRDEDLNLDLSAAYGSAGMLDEAAATIQEGLSADPGSLRLTNGLATVYVRQKRYQDAAALLKTYLDQHPGDFESQMLYLRVLVLTQDKAAARPLGKKLLAANPHDFDVLYLNGILEREADDYSTARDHLVEAVKLKPEDYSVHYNLGAALAHLDDPAGAKQQLQKAIALDGSHAEAHFQLASVLRTLGETAAAQDELRAYQQLSRASEARSQAEMKAELAAQKLAAGDAAAAATLYREAIAATPENTLLQYRLAMVLQQTGDAAGERSALEQAIHVDPTFALAQNELGYLVFHGGGAAAAEEHFRMAVKSAPAFTDAWVNLAATLASETKLAEAQGAVETALKLDPANTQAQELSRQLSAATHR